MSIKKLLVESALLNLVQASSMAMMALSIPYMLGIEGYGVYVTSNAPLIILSGLCEVILITGLSNQKDKSKFNFYIVWLICLPILIAFIYLIVAPLNLRYLSFYLFISLLVKAMIFSILICASILNKKLIFFLEFSSWLVYIITITLAYLNLIKYLLLPYFMIITASIIYISIGFSVLYKAKINFIFKKISIKQIFLRAITSRFYEDSFILFIPFLFGTFHSPTAAGYFRLIGSFVKGITKVTPLRYDTLLIYFNLNKNMLKIRPTIQLICFLGFIIIAGLFSIVLNIFINQLFPNITINSFNILACCFIGLGVIFYPIFCREFLQKVIFLSIITFY